MAEKVIFLINIIVLSLQMDLAIYLFLLIYSQQAQPDEGKKCIEY